MHHKISGLQVGQPAENEVRLLLHQPGSLRAQFVEFAMSSRVPQPGALDLQVQLTGATTSAHAWKIQPISYDRLTTPSQT